MPLAEDELVLGIPDVIEIVPVRVEPQIVVVVLKVENVGVAVGVSICTSPSSPPLVDFSSS